MPGRSPGPGTIEQGNTVSDFHPDEKEHQQSIHATVMAEEWLGRELNIIDCPGTPDFISEPLSALRVADSAMIVISGVNGVETGADEVWAAAGNYDIPRFLVINLLDRERTRFDDILEEARDHYGARVFPMTLPVDAGPGFSSVLDVMRSEVITFAADGSGKYTEKPAEGALKERVTELHRQLIDMVAESEDELLEKFFEEGTLTEEDLRAHVHEAVQKGLVVPVFAASGVKNVGVSRILDFIAKYGSSPVDRATVAAKKLDGSDVSVALDDGQSVAYVFKTMHETHVGNLSFFRVYSGDVVSGSELVNANRGETERIGQLYRVNGSAREPVNSLHAGDIGAVVKLRATRAGDTLCAAARQVTLAAVDFPAPNTRGALVAKSKSDLNKLGEGLVRAARGGSDLRLSLRSGRRADDRFRPGRAAAPDHGGGTQAALQRGRRTGRAAGFLPGDDFRARRVETPPQETNRRRGAVRGSVDAHRVAAFGKRRGFHAVARRQQRGPRVRAVGGKGRADRLRPSVLTADSRSRM